MPAVPDSSEYAKTLGIGWNAVTDHFRCRRAATAWRNHQMYPCVRRCKNFWCPWVVLTCDLHGEISSPATLGIESWLGWSCARSSWMQWRSELSLLATKHIPRCYFSRISHIISTELHGICDASEHAYAAVVYLCMTDTDDNVQITLVTSNMKLHQLNVSPFPVLNCVVNAF